MKGLSFVRISVPEDPLGSRPAVIYHLYRFFRHNAGRGISDCSAYEPVFLQRLAFLETLAQRCCHAAAFTPAAWPDRSRQQGLLVFCSALQSTRQNTGSSRHDSQSGMEVGTLLWRLLELLSSRRSGLSIAR